MEFLVIGLIFLILLLLMVWRPFFKQNKHIVTAVGSVRDETNVRLYHEHKKELEKDYSEGGIDEENYQYLLSELNNTLLQDIENTSKDDKASDTGSSGTVSSSPISKAYSPFWPLGLSVFIIIFSVALYNKQGNYKLLTELPSGHSQKVMSQGQRSQEQMSEDNRLQQRQNEAIKHIEKLQKHIEANPDDTEAWYNLGQTYVAVGGFDEAVVAFTKVVKIEGAKADLFGAIAQALYYKNEQKITPEVQNYIDKALALDIDDASTNILLGMHNFIGQKYQQAINYWQRVINSNRQGVNIAALTEAVNEAKIRLGGTGVNTVKSSSTEASNPTNTTADNIDSGPQLKLNVSLSDEITQLLAQGEDRVVFIYAVPTNGQRMPLAAVKFKASDLPISVVLNNSQAMSPANTLGSVDKAHVYAVVSMKGGVGIKQGDYKAQALDVDVHTTDTIELIVDSLVE